MGTFTTREDITGRTYGRLYVDGYSHTKNRVAFWHCTCSCKKKVVVRGEVLKRGTTKSCGCLRIETAMEKVRERENRTLIPPGTMFGYLKVIEPVGIVSGHKAYSCVCSCGTTAVIQGNNLRSGSTKSCGCYAREQSSKRITENLKSGIIRANRGNQYNISAPDGEIVVKSGFELVYANYLIRNDIDFEYEPDTFRLPNGSRYTPDFKRLDTDRYVEIKGYAKHESLGKPLVARDDLDIPIDIIVGKDEISRYLPDGLTYYGFIRDWKKSRPPPM